MLPFLSSSSLSWSRSWSASCSSAIEFDAEGTSPSIIERGCVWLCVLEAPSCLRLLLPLLERNDGDKLFLLKSLALIRALKSPPI